MPDAGAESAPLILELSGEIDVARADEVAARGEALLDDAAAGQRIVVDLANVDFIDSSGLSGLLNLRRLAAARGSSVSVRDVPPNVAMLLRLSGIDQVLPSE